MAFDWTLRTMRHRRDGDIWINLKDVELFTEKLRNDGAPDSATIPLDEIIKVANQSEGRR